MSKDLEELSKKKYYDPKQDLWVISLNAVQKAFEPPTEEEVCNALKIFFDGYDRFRPYTDIVLDHKKICLIWENGGRTNVLDYSHMLIEDAPYLITMIGRFYEGLENE